MREAARALLMQGAFIPAMPLALNENREFDEKIQRRLVRYYLAAGADGIAAAVHTTQFAIRDPKVHLLERVLRVVMEEIREYRAKNQREILAVAGVCGPCGQAVTEARLARSLGYDAVLVSPGGLDGLSEEELLARTAAIAREIDVVGFYLQTAVGGRILSYAYWEKYCAIPGVAAIKCASFDRYTTIDVARAIAFSGREVALYTGNDDSIINDLMTEYQFRDGEATRSVRTRGGLLGHWAVWTHTAACLFKELRALKKDAPIDPKWYTLAAQITDANSAFFDTRHHFAGCIAGIHEVLRRQGLMEGIWCLDPGETLSPGQMEEIDRVYALYPHLNDDAFVRAFLESEA